MTWSCCPPWWRSCIFHGVNHSFTWATWARQIRKSLLYCMISLSVFWLDPAALWAGWPVYFMVPSTPFTPAMWARKFWKTLLYCMISLSFFWLDPAALHAGGPVYFMVQSTPSCEQRELEKIENICSIAWFPCLFFDLILLPSMLGACIFHGAKHPFTQATQARKNL